MSQAVINDDALHRWFWDLNFANGANPPPSQWKRPPLKSAAEQKQTFAYFEGLVLYMKSFPQVHVQSLAACHNVSSSNVLSSSLVFFSSRSSGSGSSWSANSTSCLFT